MWSDLAKGRSGMENDVSAQSFKRSPPLFVAFISLVFLRHASKISYRLPQLFLLGSVHSFYISKHSSMIVQTMGRWMSNHICIYHSMDYEYRWYILHPESLVILFIVVNLVILTVEYYDC